MWNHTPGLAHSVTQSLSIDAHTSTGVDMTNTSACASSQLFGRATRTYVSRGLPDTHPNNLMSLTPLLVPHIRIKAAQGTGSVGRIREGAEVFDAYLVYGHQADFTRGEAKHGPTCHHLPERRCADRPSLLPGRAHDKKCASDTNSLPDVVTWQARLIFGCISTRHIATLCLLCLA